MNRFSGHQKLICGGLLAGVCLMGAAWGSPRQRPIPAIQESAGSIEAGSSVAALIRQLDHPNGKVRREAIIRLGELGPVAAAAFPTIVEHLQDRDLLVRAHAARAAFQLGLAPEPVVPVLTDLLPSDKLPVSGLAALILGEIGAAARDALPALKDCLSSTSVILRLHAAEAILKIDPDDSEALNELLTALEFEQSDTRYFAVNALGSAAIQNEEAVFALLRALTDGETNVAAAAGLNLTRLGDRLLGATAPEDVSAADEPPSVELAQMIDDLSHESPQVRQGAAIRLAMTGPTASCASEALHARLDDPDLVVRVQVAQALWSTERKSDDLLPALVDLLQVDHPNVGLAAAFVLGQMRAAAKPVLPVLHDRFANSEFLDRLLLADIITRIGPRERTTLATLIDGLHDPEGDVRYLSAVALGDAPLVVHARIERELTGAQNDRNLRVQAAAGEALLQLQSRLTHYGRKIGVNRGGTTSDPGTARRAVATRVEAAAPVAAARQAAIEARMAAQDAAYAAAAARAVVIAHKRMKQSDLQRHEADEPSVPAIDDPAIAQNGGEEGDQPVVDDDPDEGLKPIGQVRASIRMQNGQFPPDVAAPRFASLPVQIHGYGARRGWSNSWFGWEAPAVFFKPLYFEDINLERYGIHHGCLQPVISFGHFFTRCVCLPYKLAVQPPCECIYTLGYERPNNCMPLYCYTKLGWPTYSKWCQRCPCPVYPPCPWERSEDDVCTDDEDDGP